MSRLSRFIHFYTDEDEGNGGGGDPGIEKTVSGKIVHILDALAKPIKKLVAEINPVQSGSGDPSPENVRPITGRTGVSVVRTGKNLYSRDGSEYNVPVYSTNGTATAYPDVCVWWIKAKPNTKYTVSGLPATMTYYVRFTECDANKGYITRHGTLNSASLPETYTTTANTEWLQIACNQYDQNNLSKNDWQVQIEENSTATTYEPYTATTYSVTFPAAAGTVYGGTLTNQGSEWKLSVNHAEVDLGALSWTLNASFSHTFNGNALNPLSKLNPSPDSYMCSNYKTYRSDIVGNVDYGISIGNGGGTVYVRNISFTDKDEFASAISGVQLVYEFATPIEYTLSYSQVVTLLSGENNLWHSANGELEVKYLARSSE